jgi:uncharacterized protein (DUF924 family)
VISPEEVLSYWFPEGIDDADPQKRRRQGQRWMGGVPEVDREITERSCDVLEQARRGELDHWAQTPRGRLALIVVLDQFSRHAYRGSPLSYAQDEKAPSYLSNRFCKEHSANFAPRRLSEVPYFNSCGC